MLPSQEPYLPLALTILLSLVVVAGLLFLNHVLGPKRHSVTKGSPFECGSVPIGDPRRRFSVKYYLIAIFFIVFDIEAVFLYPWAVLYKDFMRDPAFAWVAMAEMFLFLGVLSIGLLYVWRRGALEWE
jgi:NADH-quinone oxidoreductase subunit A